jgi:hypothetical protein
MSLYGDYEFARAETEYRLERGRPAGWIKSRGRSVRRRVPDRLAAEVAPHFDDAA